MADRYWVGGNANWDATAGTKWATTSGGAGGAAVPNAADDVYLDNGTGTGNVSVTSTAFCRSLNCTGYTGTLTQGTSINIGDATAGAGNIALKLVAGMTFIPAGNNLNFLSTSATTQTIDFGGKTVGNLFFNAASNGSWQFVSALTCTALTLTKGTLDINGQSGTWGSFASSNGNVRSITFGAATINCNGGGGWDIRDSTNLTFSAGSSTITVSGTNTLFGHGSSAGSAGTYGTLIIAPGGGTFTQFLLSATGTPTFGNLTFTGVAAKNYGINITNNFTVTGTFTVNGNSSINRFLLASSVVGTARIITAATVSASNVDIRDITGAGTGSWNLAAITGLSGDCGGNSGITFTSPTTQTATGTASFTWSTHGWTSRVPLPQDTAIVNNAFTAGRTVTMDMPRMGTVDFSGSTGNVAVSNTVPSPGSEYYGHITLRASMGTISLNGGYHCYFMGVSQQNITMAGNANTGAFNFTIIRSRLQFQDDLIFTAVGSAGISVSGTGSCDTQGFNFTGSFFWLNNTANMNLLGSSTISVGYASAAVLIDFSTATSSRVSAASATFIVSSTSTGIRTVALAGVAIGTLTYTVAGSTGQMTITGGGTIGTLNFSDASNARTLAITSGTTITVTNLNINGTSGKLMTVQSVTASSPFTFSKASGVAYADYISLKDCTGSGGAGFVARASTNVSGNTGWAFPVTAVAAGGNWSATTTWDSGVVPTATTDVALINTSGAVTIDVAAVCRSIDCTGYTSTLTHNVSTSLTIGDATAGAGNVALKFVAGMTYTIAHFTASITFISTSATVQAINFAGKTSGSVTFNPSSNGSWQYVGAHTAAANSTVEVARGTVDINGQTCSFGNFGSSGSSTRSITLGAATMTLSGSLTFNPATSLTLSAASSTITLTGASSVFTATGTLTFGTVNFTGSGVPVITGGTLTFGTFTRTGTAVKTDGLTLVSNITVSGTCTITGNSLVNRVLVTSGTIGAARTITATTVSLSNIDFMDITGAGAASPFTGTSLGDALGNSGITFTTPVTRYAVTAGNWSSTSMWSASSGGATGASVPLCHDTVIMDASSGAGTYVADMPRMGADINCAGFTRTLSLSSLAHIQYGSLTLSSGMTLAHTQSHSFNGRSSHTITSAGKSFGAIMFVRAPGGTYTLQDAFTISPGTSQLQVDNGTFTANNFDITIPVFAATLASTINMGTGTWNITFNASTGFPWQMSASVTLNASTSTIVISSATTATRTFTGGGKTYGNLTYTVANSPGPLIIANSNTFANLNIGSGRTLTLTSGTTNTVTNFNASGSTNGFLYLSGGSGNYASTPDSPALSMTGDIDVRCKVALDSWASGTAQTLISKFVFSTPNASYWFGMDGTGRFQFSTSPDGASGTVINSFSSSVTGFTAGSLRWCRATLQANDGAGHNIVKFYTSNDGSNWTQFGSTVTNTGATLIYDSTAPLEIGSDNIGTNVLATGKFYNAQVRNNILDNGTGIVFDADFTTKPLGANTFTESSSNAATVTISGTQARVGDGRVGINATTPGSAATLSKASGLVSCNYMSIQDSTASGGAQWYAGAASLNISNNSGWIFSTARDGSFLDFF